MNLSETVFLCRPRDGEAGCRARIFAPGEGDGGGDPVCGSGNGAIAAYVARHLDKTKTAGAYRVKQGIEICRDGSIHLSWKRQGKTLEIEVGGQAVTVLRGELLRQG
ncbi:PhzF family phenazine biosynthesis protein [Stappia sp. ICDLI1TA098]